MYNILILGMGGEVSKGILKAIRHSAIPCHIVGACISPDSEGLYLCEEAYISPYAKEPSFLPWLASLCKEKRIDMVFTGVEENIFSIAKGKEYLKKHTSAVFRVSDTERLRIGGDKLETCRWLERHGFPTPHYANADNKEEICELIRKVGFPLIAKPRDGKGSAGVFLIREEVDTNRLQGLSNYVLEEYVGTPEEEYTVGCYRGLRGEVPEPIIMKRTLKNGASWRVEVIKNEKILGLAKNICEAFQPDGPLNIQLRLNSHEIPVPFELNVRFSGTTPMREHFGFCDVKAMLYESLLHREISSCFSIRSGVAYRYTEELYLPDLPMRRSNGEMVWRNE